MLSLSTTAFLPCQKLLLVSLCLSYGQKICFHATISSVRVYIIQEHIIIAIKNIGCKHIINQRPVCIQCVMVQNEPRYSNPTFGNSHYPSAENEDYNSTLVPDKGTLSLQNNIRCHSMEILDDSDVEPPETFFVSITATGPSQEFINLFNITEQTVVQILDDDSE